MDVKPKVMSSSISPYAQDFIKNLDRALA